MRVFAIIGTLLLGLLTLSLTATAGEKSMGINEVRHVTFHDQVRIGTSLMQPGDYEVRHTMEGQEHIMVFKGLTGRRDEVRVKCSLVSLDKKAAKSVTIYELNAANEKVLRELIFSGDSTKHVF